AEDGIRDFHVTGVQTCALPIYTPTYENHDRADQEQHDAEQRYGHVLIGGGLSGKVRIASLREQRERRDRREEEREPRRHEQPERSEARRVGTECLARGWKRHRV